MPKTISVTEAEQQLTAATAAVDQIKARLVDEGPGSVTAEELGAAVLAVEHAKLIVQHALQAAEDSAAAERLDNLGLLKAQILREAGDVDTIRDAMQMVADGSAIIVRFLTGRQTLISQGLAAMRRAGVPQGDRPDEQHAGLGWSDAGMGLPVRLHVDGRTIGWANAGIVIASGVARGAREAGRKEPQHLLPLDIKSVADQGAVNDPEAWLTRRL